MGEENKILTFRFLGVKTEPRTARLYHMIPKSSMGEENKILTKRFLGVKTEPRTARLYHMIPKSSIAGREGNAKLEMRNCGMRFAHDFYNSESCFF